MTLTAPARTAPARPARAGAVPVAFTGSWPALTAWSTGLIVAALGAGGVVGPGAMIAGRVVGILAFTLALATLAWGTAVLMRGRMLLPRVVLAGSLAGVVLLALLLATAPAHTSVYAVAVGTVLLVAIAAMAARSHRRGPGAPRAVSVWGLILAAAVMSVVVTPALSSAQDAVLIQDDGTVPVISHEGH
ncbi:hypothetical protein ACIQLJ_13375 [Microbacterium sp. NPDC091313]